MLKSTPERSRWIPRPAAREVGVAGVPGSSFFHEPENRYIRFHFAKKEETLRPGAERLMKLADSAAQAKHLPNQSSGS